MCSEKKRAANKENGKKSRGPKNTERTRFNATTHGLTAKGLIDPDEAAEYEIVLEDLIKRFKPQNELTRFLVETAAFEIIRARRARRYQAEFLLGLLHPTKYEADSPVTDIFKGKEEEIKPAKIIEPGLPPSIEMKDVEKLSTVYARYEATSLKNLFRAVHETERIGRMEAGEYVPPPVAVDVAVHGESGPLDSSSTETQDARASVSNEESELTAVTDADDVTPSVASSAASSLESIPENRSEAPMDSADIAPSRSSSVESLANPAPDKAPKAAPDQSKREADVSAPWTPGPPRGPLWHKS